MVTQKAERFFSIPSRLNDEAMNIRPSEQHQEDVHKDEYLSNHTISMRAALNYCRELLLKPLLDSSSVHIHTQHAIDAWNAAQTISQQRQDALEDICMNLSIPTIQFEGNMSVLDFRRQFLHANRPCLIQGLPHFTNIARKWRTQESEINKDWFSKHVGDDTLVPVRKQCSEQQLDDEGRAQECTTVEMPLREWLHNHSSRELYLKDWHLQKIMWEKHTQSPPLYTIPEIFGNDLLNNFLLKFTGGDYRFVYWGPPGSQTPLHSDVLHSFSWSYNVVGKKKWTFHIGDDYYSQLVVIQNAGETVFVPSTFLHSVENLSQALSLNHNWITTANIDLTWDCLRKEMTLINVELEKWDNTSWDAKEFMLRGCVGLDVTAFFFMALTAQLDLLTQGRNDDWERFFDMFRLHQVLEALTKPEVHLQERLTSVLGEETLALEAIDAATTAMCVVDNVKAELLLVDNGL